MHAIGEEHIRVPALQVHRGRASGPPTSAIAESMRGSIASSEVSFDLDDQAGDALPVVQAHQAVAQ